MTRIVAKSESEIPPMKRIGIIGGWGQWATLDILQRILKYSATKVPQFGNRGYPPIDLRLVDHAPMKLNPDGTFPEHLESTPELRDAAKYVGQQADFIIVPSNTPHLFAREIEQFSGKPLLSIVDVTVKEVVRRKYRKVGIIAIGLTLDKHLYQDPLEKRGIATVVPSKEMSDTLDQQGIWPIQEGAAVSEVTNNGQAVLDYLRGQGAEGIILGCTEVPILLGSRGEASDIVNPSQLLAEAAVDRALKE